MPLCRVVSKVCGLCGHSPYLNTYMQVIYRACSLEGTSKHVFEDDFGLAHTILGCNAKLIY